MGSPTPPHEAGSRRAETAGGGLATMTVVFLAAVAAAVGFMACSNTNGTASDGTTSTLSSAPSATAKPARAEAAILDGYRAAWDAYEAATDPDDPRLAAHMTGEELRQVRLYIASLKAQGWVGTGTIELHPRVESFDATTAKVVDCIDDGGHLIEAKTGKRVGEPAGAPERVNRGWEATLTIDGGVWKMAELRSRPSACPA